MHAFLFTLAQALVAFAATPAANPAAVPTPIPINLPPTVFHQVSWGSQHPGVVTAVQWLFALTAVGLITLMSVQTTKNEGLSGSIGGRAEAAYRGRIGLDEQLKRLTAVIAVAFMLLAIAYFWLAR